MKKSLLIPSDRADTGQSIRAAMDPVGLTAKNLNRPDDYRGPCPVN